MFTNPSITNKYIIPHDLSRPTVLCTLPSSLRDIAKLSTSSGELHSCVSLSDRLDASVS